MSLLARLEPDIGRHLLRDEGEDVVDVITKHWAAYTRPLVEAAVALVLLATIPFVDLDLAWVPLVLCLAVLAHAVWRSLQLKVDRFVVTNMRVFRIHGVLNRQMATVPLIRILDITVEKPLTGRLLGYGHFVFESAAQEQGLREIRFVARPDVRDLEIQRMLQRSGIRGGPRVNR
ncbi:PH domain-containing protein [Nocardioides sp.]|uniref:PH domain-containing protein n=1 Tax=Nocardioides sp. TaxID=35761 RepID=UPI003527F1FF